jgi:hypothetical protein
MKARRICGMLLLFGLGIPACSSRPAVPVEGKVTLDGKPLTHGSIAFWPEDESLPPACGEITKEGTYALYSEGQEGAVVGTYRVTVVCQSEVDSTAPEKVKSFVPEKYSRKETSKLVVRVVEDPADGAYDLNLNLK